MATALEPLAPTEAMAFFRSKGLAPEMQRFDWRDHWREEHARAFVVAKAMKDDVLRTIREEVDRALAEGRTLDQFRADLTPMLQAFGWWGNTTMVDPLTGQTREVRLGTPHRLRTIFDTNMRTAYAAGRWARIQRTKGAFPYLEYRQIQRPTKRDDHALYHGLVRPVDDPVWQEIYPPNGWFCGCSVRQVNDRILKREGKTVSPPFRPEREAWTNRRTGGIEFPPKGVHPGFDSNPGATWLDLRDRHRAVTGHLPPQAAAVDLSLTQEIRARGLRDRDESLAMYDGRTGEVLAWNRSEDGVPNAVRIPDIPELEEPGGRVVLIHSHPSSSSLSPQDLVQLWRNRGLGEIVAVGFDGSLYRARLAAGRGLGLDDIEEAVTIAWSGLTREVSLGRMTDADRRALTTHVMALGLRDGGAIAYDHEVSGRMAALIGRHGDLIAALARRIAEAM